MTTTIDVRDLPSRLEAVIAEAEEGTEVLVSDGNIVRARLLPFPKVSHMQPGLFRGAITTTDEFDEPMSDDFWTTGE